MKAGWIIAGLATLIFSAEAVSTPAWSQESQVAAGAYLARAGDCVVCHTAELEKPFAGGVKMATPFGAIYTTNITPDSETGIGQYSFEDFARAMRHGVARDGHRLFPAMPYPSYARINDADMRALYAYFMSGVTAVRQANRPSELPVLSSLPRVLDFGLAVWQTLFVPSVKMDSQNRGAYLVEGLGHCGSCHTPRGIFFQELALDSASQIFLSGALLDDWSAPNLRPDFGNGLGSWDIPGIRAFLKTGHGRNTSAFGTMVDVVNNSTQYLTDDDLLAISAYLKALPSSGRPNTSAIAVGHRVEPYSPAVGMPRGAEIYMRRCAGCHGADGMGHGDHVPSLDQNAAVLDHNTHSLVNVVLNGSARLATAGMVDPYRMIAFRDILSDEEVAEVLAFIRREWHNNQTGVAVQQVSQISQATVKTCDQAVILRMK